MPNKEILHQQVLLCHVRAATAGSLEEGVLQQRNSTSCLFIMWLACHNRLATNDGLYKFGKVDNRFCVFCDEIQSIQLMFFTYQCMNDIWKKILEWINVDQKPRGWIQELAWIKERSKSKSCRSIFLKTAFADMVYSCWKYRNKKVHDKIYTTNISEEVIDTIVHQLWMKKNIESTFLIFL